jgi:GNAT superfamily N-acetyltransferase
MIPKPPLPVRIANTQLKHVPALAALQRVVFPTLSDDELLTEEKYRKHLEIFPEGQFVALIDVDGQETVVGSASAFRTNFNFDEIQHTFLEAVDDGWLTNHDPNGEWLYGADMSVHPDYRGRRIGRRLYEARQQLVYELNLRGEIAAAMLPGYHYHRARLRSVAHYILRVKQGHLFDPTLSMQLKNGFRVRGILYNHITDPRSNNTATLIVRENRHYQPPAESAEPPEAKTPRRLTTKRTPRQPKGLRAQL